MLTFDLFTSKVKFASPFVWAIYIYIESIEVICRSTAGVRLQGDWGKIVAPEGSKLPWEALRAIKASPLIFATF